MLLLRETRIVKALPAFVATGVTIVEEGIPLVWVKENGEAKVQPCTGAAGEIFAGLSWSRSVPPTFISMIEEGVVAADNTFPLTRNPVQGQILIKVNGVPLTIVAGAPAHPTEVQIGNLVLNFNGVAGQAVFVQYMYNPTTAEARTLIGDAPIGGLASSARGTIGVLKDAVAATNYFDASADWSEAMYVKTMAGGLLTVGAANDHIQGVRVQTSPSSATPFLSVSLLIG